MNRILIAIAGCIVLFLNGCKQKTNTLFSRLSESETGITFRNLLKEDNPEFNILFYPYFYNGGGVAVGDINNDGLADVFFTGNMVKNRLFLNQGEMEFEDITVKSKVAEKEGWCTGASMIDINQDGWLDIYVCRSGLSNQSLRTNLLFINNKDLTFTESAKAYGLDDAGYSTQSSFFDYDLDGDLDMILINQSVPKYSQGKIEYLQLRGIQQDSVFRNKLFRNDGGRFTDVSSAAGIASNVLTFSLGVSTADINLDGFPDIYITNDFKEPDYYYVNNGNGTFTEQLREAFDHASLYAMGVDVSDYNNDLLPDIITLDMFAEDNKAQKMHMGGDNYTQYNYLFQKGMFHQFMRNTLQKNNGDGTFSEVAQLAGVSNTDWSWAPLFADVDNDGLKDLFISNGYKRDNTDIEFIVYSMNESIRIQKGGGAVAVQDYISHMPGIHLPNYIYKNTGDDRFENKVTEWGFNHNTFSHGAAYVDLDNDGDLDIITNNTDEYAGIYRNNSKSAANHYLKVKFNGAPQNKNGIGCKAYVYSGNLRMYEEQLPVRGYQSAVDQILHFGLGANALIDSMTVIWPGGHVQRLKNIHADQTLTVNVDDARENVTRAANRPTVFRMTSLSPPFQHLEKDDNDFQRQFLLPHTLTHQGPCLVKGDINGDHLEDVIAAGEKDQPLTCFLQATDGSFRELKNRAFESDAKFEASDMVLFDADGDHDLDLYATSGGYALPVGSELFADRFYLNDGKGIFKRTPQDIPKRLINKGAVAYADVDGDGDPDLFIGGSVKPGAYPLFEESKILLNDGKGKFVEAGPDVFRGADVGIVNDAIFADVNSDGKVDLLVASDWQPLLVFINEGKRFSKDDKLFASAGSGFWKQILAEDLDGDGDLEIVAGNYGMNSQLTADESHPVTLYAADYDNNGSIDPIITHFIGGAAYPMIPRDDLNGQIPIMKKKFSDYKKYADATINEIFTPEQLKNSSIAKVTNLRTVLLVKQGNTFVSQPLPIEVQYSPVFSISAIDIDADNRKDLLLAGNLTHNRIYLGRHDANHGILLRNGAGGFRFVSSGESGLQLRGDVRSSAVIGGDKVVFGINGKPRQTYELSKNRR